jgi:hypothetical protein
MCRLYLVAAVAALLSSPAMSQTPATPAPWDQPFLPPVPVWNGASRALLADDSNPWITDFERDPDHNFSPD